MLNAKDCHHMKIWGMVYMRRLRIFSTGSWLSAGERRNCSVERNYKNRILQVYNAM